MNFIEFTKSVDAENVIDIRNVVNYFDGMDRRRLYEWQKKGYLIKITNNFYYMADLKVSDDLLKVAANKMRKGLPLCQSGFLNGIESKLTPKW